MALSYDYLTLFDINQVIYKISLIFREDNSNNIRVVRGLNKIMYVQVQHIIWHMGNITQIQSLFIIG